MTVSASCSSVWLTTPQVRLIDICITMCHNKCGNSHVEKLIRSAAWESLKKSSTFQNKVPDVWQCCFNAWCLPHMFKSFNELRTSCREREMFIVAEKLSGQSESIFWPAAQCQKRRWGKKTFYALCWIGLLVTRKFYTVGLMCKILLQPFHGPFYRALIASESISHVVYCGHHAWAWL